MSYSKYETSNSEGEWKTSSSRKKGRSRQNNLRTSQNEYSKSLPKSVPRSLPRSTASCRDLRSFVKTNASNPKFSFKDCIDYIEKTDNNNNSFRSKSLNGEENDSEDNDITDSTSALRLELIYRLLQQAEKNSHLYNLFVELLEEKKYLRKDNTVAQYCPINAIAWWTTSSKHELFEKIVKNLSDAGFNIFAENIKGETSLGSVISKYSMDTENPISYDEMRYRYWTVINNVSSLQVKKIINNCLNKLSDTNENNNKFICQLKFCLIMKPVEFCDNFINNIIRLKCGGLTHNPVECFSRYVKLFNDVLGNINNTMPDLELFFKEYANKSKSKNEVIDMFMERLVVHGFNSQGDYKQLTMEATASIIGELHYFDLSQAKYTEYYQELVMKCIDKSENELINLPQDINLQDKLKIAFRAIVQFRTLDTTTKFVLVSINQNYKKEELGPLRYLPLNIRDNLEKQQKTLESENTVTLEGITDKNINVKLPEYFKKMNESYKIIDNNNDKMQFCTDVLMDIFDNFHDYEIIKRIIFDKLFFGTFEKTMIKNSLASLNDQFGKTLSAKSREALAQILKQI